MKHFIIVSLLSAMLFMNNLATVESGIFDFWNWNKPSRQRLFNATRDGDLITVQEEIRKGINLNVNDTYKNTALHFAAYYGQMSVARFLIDEGANVNALNWDEWTPLHFAAQNGYVDMVRLLLNKGALSYAQNDGGETPMDRATATGQTEVVELLKNIPPSYVRPTQMKKLDILGAK